MRTIEAALELAARLIRDDALELRDAVYRAGEWLDPEDPDGANDMLWDEIYTRLGVLASMTWEGHMGGSGSVSIQAIAFAPDSIWTAEVEMFHEIEITLLDEYRSLPEANSAAFNGLLALMRNSGPPDEVKLPDGVMPTELRKYIKGFLDSSTPGEYEGWTWEQLADRVASFGPNQAEVVATEDRDSLLDRYVELAVRGS